MFFKSRMRFSCKNSDLVSIARDGLISVKGRHDDKLIPFLRLDTSSRSDIDEMIDFHSHRSGGDVEIKWGTLKGDREKIFLIMECVRPYETFFVIPLDIANNQIIIESILNRGVVCLEGGISNDLAPIGSDDRVRIIVHIPESTFKDIWPKIRDKALYRDFRKKGMTRRAAKSAALQKIGFSSNFLSY